MPAILLFCFACAIVWVLFKFRRHRKEAEQRRADSLALSGTQAGKAIDEG